VSGVWNIAARRKNKPLAWCLGSGEFRPTLGNAHERTAKTPAEIGVLAQTKRKTPVAEAGTEDMS